MHGTDMTKNKTLSAAENTTPRRPWSTPRFKELEIGTATLGGAMPWNETLAPTHGTRS